MKRISLGIIGGCLFVSVALGASVTWNLTTGGLWDTTTGNWTGGSPTANLFVNGDDALFNKTQGGTITIVGGITPNSTTVSNTTTAYYFSGSLGGGSLTKAGAGSLILSNANSFSSVTISTGTVQVINTGSLGAGTVNLAAGGTLALIPAGPNNYGNAINVTGTGTATINNRPSGGGAPTNTLGNLTIGGQTLVVNGAGSGGGNSLKLIMGNVSLVGGSPTFSIFKEPTGGGSHVVAVSGITEDATPRSITVVGDNTVGSPVSGLIITGGSSYSGGTIINGVGMLQASADNALGSGAITINSNGTLRASTTNSLRSSAGGTPLPITLAGGGRLYLQSGFNTGYSNAITVTGSGTATIIASTGNEVNDVLGPLTISNQTLSSSSWSTGTGGPSANPTVTVSSVTMNGPATFDVQNEGSGKSGTWVFGPVSEDASSRLLTKTGVATLRLTSSNAYSGGTVISAGTLMSLADYALGSGPVTNNAGCMLVAGTASAMNSNASPNGPLSITLASSSILELRNDASTIFDGNVTITGGGIVTVQVSKATSGNIAPHTLKLLNIGNQTAVVKVGTFGGVTGGTYLILTINSVVLSGNATFYVDQTTDLHHLMLAMVSEDLAGGRALTKTGVGRLTLTGANTYSGDTKITAGSLVVSNALALQSSTLDYNYAGTFSFGAGLTAATFGGLKGSTNIVLPNPFTLSVGNNGQTNSYNGQLSGTGASLVKVGSGMWSLNGSNTYSGATTVSNGTLLINGWLSATNSAVTITAGGTLGGTGTIQRAVTVQSGGTLRGGIPGTAGSLTISSNVTLNSGAALACDVVDGAASSINVTGTLILPSTATVNVTRAGTQITSYAPLFTAGSISNLSMSGWTVIPSTYRVTLSGNQLSLRLRAGFMFMAN